MGKNASMTKDWRVEIDSLKPLDWGNASDGWLCAFAPRLACAYMYPRADPILSTPGHVNVHAKPESVYTNYPHPYREREECIEKTECLPRAYCLAVYLQRRQRERPTGLLNSARHCRTSRWAHY